MDGVTSSLINFILMVLTLEQRRSNMAVTISLKRRDLVSIDPLQRLDSFTHWGRLLQE